MSKWTVEFNGIPLAVENVTVEPSHPATFGVPPSFSGSVAIDRIEFDDPIDRQLVDLAVQDRLAVLREPEELAVIRKEAEAEVFCDWLARAVTRDA